VLSILRYVRHDAIPNSQVDANISQLHTSYSSLGRDFKSLFEDLLKHIDAQKTEADALRQQLNVASELSMQASSAASAKLEDILREEREQVAADRQTLLSQITSLVIAQGETQDSRLSAKIGEVQKDVISSKASFEASRAQYGQGMDAWNEKEGKLVEEVLRSRETLKSKLKEDWVVSYCCSFCGLIFLTFCRPRTNTTHLFNSPPNLCTQKLFVLLMSK
jgi:kinesin family protein 11